MNKPRIAVFGEVLFDHFPDGTQILGGAPFNVAWHLQALKQNVQFISRVGDDAQGQSILSAMQAWGMDTRQVQIDKEYATGSVVVSFVDDQPEYQILDQQAYDYINDNDLFNHDWQLLYHGSLALRNPRSQQTLTHLKSQFSGQVFVDVNLRAPWWQADVLDSCLADADWIKLNAEELQSLMAGNESLENSMRSFIRHVPAKCLIVTLGEEGAVALTKDSEFIRVRPEKPAKLVDTVGAGDAFSAVVLLGLQQGWSLPLTLQRAQAFASGVVERRGATVNEPEFYLKFVQEWQL